MGRVHQPKRQAWADIEALAAEFLACDSSDAKTASRAWHHLLLAVGNFKRRGGLILPPTLSAMRLVQAESCRIPGAPQAIALLSCEDQATWARLTDTLGVGVPTATTLLSALFPCSHVIIDTRATRAAIGVGVGARWDVTGLNDHELPDVAKRASYWQLYTEWYRPLVLATADALGCEPVSVERALYCLDELTMKQLRGTNWFWTDYRPVANRWLDNGSDN